MFNSKKFVLVLFVCINTVTASNNITARNTLLNNSNIAVIQNNIRDFIITCNNEDDFSIGQKSMMHNIVKSIKNINTNNLNHLSLITLEAENKNSNNEYLVQERTITFRYNKNLNPRIEFAEEPSKITENKYKNLLNCINICSKANIISKEEHFNFLKILLENNITGLVNYFSYETSTVALDLLYENLKQLSDHPTPFKSRLNEEFINRYWTCNFKTFRIMIKIASNMFNILEHSSKSNDNIEKYYFKLLKNNYTKNKNQKYLSEVEINTNEIQPTNNMIKLYDCIKECYIKAATKSLEIDRKKCNNYNTYKLPTSNQLNTIYAKFIDYLNNDNNKIKILNNLLSLQDNYNEFRKDFLTYVKLLGNNKISKTNINKNNNKSYIDSNNDSIKFNKNTINDILKVNVNNNSNKLKSDTNNINNILKLNTIDDKSKLKIDINNSKLQNKDTDGDLIISAHNVEANKEKVEYFNNKDFANKQFEYSKKFLQNINSNQNSAVFPNNILKYLINTNTNELD